MQITRVGCIGVVLFGLSLPLLGQPDRIAGFVDRNRRVVLSGSIHPKAQSQYDAGAVDPSLELGYVTLLLKPSALQQAELDQLLREQQDPFSPNHHKWLTPEQYAGRFGVSRGDMAKIVEWLRSEGLTVNDVARGRRWISFTGTAARVSSAFGVKIHSYRVQGANHYANAAEPSIPAALAGVVSGVHGLDDFGLESRVAGNKPLPLLNSGSRHFLAPGDLAAIYDINPLYAAGIDGTGQKVAVVGQAPVSLTDVQAFRKQFNLPPNDPQVILAGPAPGANNAASMEANLDVEWAGAVARNASIVFVYARSAYTAAQYAVDQNLASVLSMSLGLCEPESSPGLRSIAQQANAQGITWLASSGDAGGADCDPQASGQQAVKGLAVDFPSSLPEVTAVGGTQFAENGGAYWAAAEGDDGTSALSYIPEAAWNESGVSGLGASGGGASIFFSKPPWQNGPGVPADGVRDVPDVALTAAIHDGYFIIAGSVAYVVSGTSASTPAFAGIIALLNHYLVSNGLQAQPGLGNINPQLYRLAQSTSGVFHDITAGHNRVPCAQLSPGCSTGSLGYSAAPGYDQATGLGSVDANSLITQWNSQTLRTSMTLTADSTTVALDDKLQLSATVSAPNASGTPSGSVSFNVGDTALGSAPLAGAAGTASATFTISTNRLPPGVQTITAIYGGGAAWNGSSASLNVTVNVPSGVSAVVPSVTPAPVFGRQTDSNTTWTVTVKLTETAGISTTLTGYTIDGVSHAQQIPALFGRAGAIPANSSNSADIVLTGLTVPATSILGFSGADAGGATWSFELPVTFYAPLLVPFPVLSIDPSNVKPNPAADPSCQLAEQLKVHERNGFGLRLTRLVASGRDISDQIQSIFGTTRVAPFGVLQGTLCWTGISLPAASTLQLDGADERGSPFSVSLSPSFSNAAAPMNPLSVAPKAITMPARDATQPASASLKLDFGGSALPWTVAVYPADRTTAWLKVSPQSGMGPAEVSLQASAAGFGKGVYSATLVFQSAAAAPQLISVPVAFVVGASSSTSVGGVRNGASSSTSFAPGMLINVFGSELAPSTERAAGLPLPLEMSGVSATVNNMSAPLYYVSPGQLNIQIPYETSGGTAILGVNNNGQVSSFMFQVAASAPGIFVDQNGSVIPSSSAQRGSIATIYLTGDGDVSPPLVTGAAPPAGTPIARLPRALLPLSVSIAGQPAAIQFSGIPTGLVGVTQINFTIPGDAPLGPQPVVVTAGGVSSPAANLNIMQ